MIYSIKVRHPYLKNSVQTMRSKNSLRSGGLSDVEMSDYLVASVSKSPDYLAQNRNMSMVNLSTNSSPESRILTLMGTYLLPITQIGTRYPSLIVRK